MRVINQRTKFYFLDFDWVVFTDLKMEGDRIEKSIL